MGICLAIKVLEGRATGAPHGGVDEACDELIRESFWMTDAEIEAEKKRLAEIKK